MPAFEHSGVFRRLWLQFGARRRIQLGLLLVLMVLTSFAEMLTIGAVLPFLSVLMQPELVFKQAAIQPLIHFLGVTTPSGMILPLTLAFGAAAVLAGTMRIGLLVLSTRLSFALGSDLSNKLYRKALHEPYPTHIARNSSEVVSVIWGKVSEITFFIIVPLMLMISAAISIVVIAAMLLLTVPTIALVAIGCLAGAYVAVVLTTKHRLKRNSKTIADESTRLVKALQEGMGGIRDILLNSSQAVFAEDYRKIDRILRRAQGSNQIMAGAPRFAIESMGILLFAALGYVLAQQPSGVAAALPQMAVVALGLQRLLPAAQQLYNAWSSINGSLASLHDVLTMAERSSTTPSVAADERPLAFDQAITLDRVSFRYQPSAPWVLRDVSLTIPKGARVGFIGATGAGKSTLLDIVLGLLHPEQGSIRVDDCPVTPSNAPAWQKHIAHVPQTIFLSDSSIAENIAFGVPAHEIDAARVRQAADLAQLGDVVETLPEQYRTRVGERGIQLSGGQRQRIGLARALYRNADVIVLDEATSALDAGTEQAVMQAIDSLAPGMTVLIIAHRHKTLANCNMIIEVANGGITQVGQTFHGRGGHLDG